MSQGMQKSQEMHFLTFPTRKTSEADREVFTTCYHGTASRQSSYSFPIFANKMASLPWSWSDRCHFLSLSQQRDDDHHKELQWYKNHQWSMLTSPLTSPILLPFQLFLYPEAVDQLQSNWRKKKRILKHNYHPKR